jgi:hypothetical protein
MELPVRIRVRTRILVSVLSSSNQMHEFEIVTTPTVLE